MSYSGVEYICSQPDSSGMHKCADLPPYVVDGRECSGSIETGLHNKERKTRNISLCLIPCLPIYSKVY